MKLTWGWQLSSGVVSSLGRPYELSVSLLLIEAGIVAEHLSGDESPDGDTTG